MHAALLALSLSFAPTPGPAPTFSPTDPLVAVQDPERLEAWPKLDAKHAAEAKTEVARLRKARTETMGADAAEKLVALGAGTAPLLLSALGHEKSPATRDAIRSVLDRLTGAPHTRLLAEAFADRSVVTRIWALRRAARFPDPGTRAQAEGALSSARKVRRGKSPDPELVLAASLACASAGSAKGFDALFEDARANWAADGALLRIAFAELRGKEMTARLAEHLDDSARATRLAALRLLGAAGVRPEGVAAVEPFLDNEDAGLVTAAVNALRGIVDGKPPLERLSAFETIEQAKAWKKRLR
ncbi:MAG TPA: hypothetical protein ENJ09_05375 [Planctomycetes bacterium]|nr:hypothetical protein [Planctomycetota bacterium]